jgi:probable rRNA maturation factor
MQELSRGERAGRDVRPHKSLCTKTLCTKILGTKTLGTRTLGLKIPCTMPHSIIPVTEVLVVAGCWQDEPEAEAVIQRAIAAAAETVDADVGDAELAVMLTDDSGIRTLNSNWRGIDKPTNVLSFPALQPTAPPQVGDAPRMLGDIAIAYETLRKEADDDGKPFDHHLSHLAVHGFLHLIGYDHEQDDQAEAMEALEREILAQLGIPDPYADRERMD